MDYNDHTDARASIANALAAFDDDDFDYASANLDRALEILARYGYESRITDVTS